MKCHFPFEVHSEYISITKKDFITPRPGQPEEAIEDIEIDKKREVLKPDDRRGPRVLKSALMKLNRPDL